MSPCCLPIALLICVLFPPLAASHAQTAANLPPHPRLLLDQTDVASLKERIAGPFEAQWKDYRAAVDRTLSDPVDLPPRGGNWGHNYVCPTHGSRLKRGTRLAKWEWEHICPVGPHTLKGDPSQATTDFDGNGIASVHMDYSEQLTQLGVVYQVTRDDRYARRAREVLLAYADAYLTYPLHDNQGRLGPNPGKAGHVASQSLTEATWIIGATHGADLIWETLSPDDRTRIETKLLRPAIDEVVIPGDKNAPHNIQCRHNSAIGLVGFLLGDERLINRAINQPVNGFRDQLAKGVLDDGFWLEGASGYHFFTIEGLWPLAEAARHCGIDLYGERFKKMFDVPLALAMPDLRLPNFNDSGFVALSDKADAYELAYARWKDESYLRLIRPSKRTGKLAMLYGVAEIPMDAQASTPTPVASRNLDVSGYAILQRGADKNATWLAMKYGPHGGWHGHFDKNHFILYARGNVVMPDPGTHAYGSPLHKGWDRTSLAHNTLVVDGRSQAEAHGRCLAFGSDKGVDFTMTDAGDIYPDKKVRFVRTVVLVNENLIVAVDEVRAATECVFDIAMHLSGQWDTLPEGQPRPAPEGDGYAHVTDLTTRIGEEPLTFGTKAARITLGEGHLTETMTGTSVGESTAQRVPIAIFRRKAKAANFVWAIALDEHANNTETIFSDDPKTIAVLTNTPQGPVRFYVNSEARTVRVNKEPLP